MAQTSAPNVRLQRLIADNGWTQARTAELINAEVERATGTRGNYTGEQIRQLERGETTWPHSPYRRAICAIFGLSSESEAGLRPKRPGPSMVADGHEIDENMRRVEFMRGLTTSPATAGLPPAVQRSSMSREHVPQRIGPEDVHQVTKRADVLRAADHAGHPPSGEAMEAELMAALRLLDANADRPTKAAMQVAIGRLADVIGWSQFDAGNHAAADQYFRVGLLHAEEAGAWWLRAGVLTHMARQAVYLDRPDDALTLIGIAKVREDRLSSLRRSALCIVEARAFGELGEAREATRSVDRAVQFFQEVDDREDPDWAVYSDFFSEAQLNGDTAHGLWPVAVHGLETANTIALLEAAIPSYPDRFLRSRLFCIARLATLILLHGDPDEGVALARQALSLAGEVRSMRVRDDLAKLHQATAERRYSHPGVAELRRDLAAAHRGGTYAEPGG